MYGPFRIETKEIKIPNDQGSSAKEVRVEIANNKSLLVMNCEDLIISFNDLDLVSSEAGRSASVEEFVVFITFESELNF